MESTNKVPVYDIFNNIVSGRDSLCNRLSIHSVVRLVNKEEASHSCFTVAEADGRCS